MLFNSMEFLVFFPAVVILTYIIPGRVRYLWLLAASYYFYMCWNARYALLLLFSTAATYCASLFIEAWGGGFTVAETGTGGGHPVQFSGFILL